MKGKSAIVVKWVLIASLIGLIALAEWQLRLSASLGPDRIQEWLKSSGPLAPVVFILTMATAVVVSPIPSLPLDLVAGSFFGPLRGTLYASAGGLLGAMISFLLARFLGRELLQRVLKGHINFCARCSDKLLTKIVFVSRLLPMVSFDVVSYGAGLTSMSLLKFSLATFLGMLPLTFIYVSFGTAVLAHREVAAVLGLALVAAFFLLPRWIERYDFLGLKKYFRHSEV